MHIKLNIFCRPITHKMSWNFSTRTCTYKAIYYLYNSVFTLIGNKKRKFKHFKLFNCYFNFGTTFFDVVLTTQSIFIWNFHVKQKGTPNGIFHVTVMYFGGVHFAWMFPIMNEKLNIIHTYLPNNKFIIEHMKPYEKFQPIYQTFLDKAQIHFNLSQWEWCICFIN